LRVLVLGGTRFVGPFAVRRLAAEGHELAIFHRGETEPELPPTVKHFHGDFGRFGEHVATLRAFAPDVVVDLLPFVDKAGHGAAHSADVAERAVVLSSGDVYRAFARLLGSEPGDPDPVPLSEASPLRAGPSPDLAPDIDYDNLEVERALCSGEPPVTVLRLAVVYGPGDPYNRLGGYVRRMDDRREAIILEERVSPWRWSREYVENVAAAVAAVVADERSAGRVYNVAPKTTLTEELGACDRRGGRLARRDRARSVGGAAGCDAPRDRRAPGPRHGRVADPPRARLRAARRPRRRPTTNRGVGAANAAPGPRLRRGGRCPGERTFRLGLVPDDLDDPAAPS
jgi:nucleoside-diphosphate-sugar epimerase